MTDMRALARLLVEAARSSGRLVAAMARLRERGWSSDGWTRDRIITEIDPSFVHHSEHLDRLLHGGSDPDGRKFAGGGGLRWGGLDVSEQEAVLRVMGSFEYHPTQEIYQQTVRFANYRRVAEDAELTWPEKARMLLTMDSLRVHCDCDAYRFYHQNAATRKGFALVPENRAAPINNPSNRSGACKHLNVVLKWLGAQGSQLASEMKRHHEARHG